MATPQISYVGSVDTSSSPCGNLLISLSFPSTINALMFEYKYQVNEEIIANLNNSFYGFVYPDSVAPAQNDVDGLSKYLLPLPLPTVSELYPASVEYNVAVRVYLMGSSTSYTGWSNSLLVIRPPVQPVVINALYDEGDYTLSNSRLWIELDKNNIDTREGIKYIVSYFYVKQNTTSTSWATTGLLDLDEAISTVNSPYLSFLMDGNISVDEPVVYVAVNAVLPFQDDDENQFYSLSEISNTVTASEVAITAPVLEPLTYTENQDGSQNIVVTWSAPTNSFIPSFIVLNYVLETRIYPIDGTPPVNWTVVDDNISPTQLTYTYNINTALYPQGYTFDFRVRADLESGTETDFSNVENTLQASIVAPVQNDIVYSVYTDNNQNMIISWEAPLNSEELTMTPSEYRVYTSINSGDFSFVTTNEQQTLDREYVYAIPSQYYDCVVTNIAFKIEPVFRPLTGAFVTAVSDVKSLNTFTFATAPQGLSINWAVPDKQVIGGVDVSFVFSNVLNAGLGNVERPLLSKYLCQIVNINTQVPLPNADVDVVYDPETENPYLTEITFVPTQGTLSSDYYIKVCLQTADTNYDNELLHGAATTSSSILVSSVPIIYDVQVTSNEDIYNLLYYVSFKIASNTILAPQAALFYASTAGLPEIPIPYNTTDGNPVYVLDNWIYTFSDTNALIIEGNYEGFVLTAANEAGIGFSINNVD
jgi:hypothetical protein